MYSLLLAIIFLGFPILTEPSSLLKIEIVDVCSEEGTLLVAIYNKDVHFMSSKDRFKEFPLVPSREKVSFTVNLPRGDYAIAILHDENGDEKMNQNFLGMPSEAFGFSNNPRVGFSTPTFDDCKFKVRQKKESIKIDLVHW